MHLEEFARGGSLIHKLDPRVKLVAALALSTTLAVLNDLPAILLGLAGSVALCALARLGFKDVLTRLALVNSFILFLWFFLPFSHPGRVVFELGPFKATEEGFFYTLTITLKSNAIILTLISLIATSTVFSLVHALRHLKAPDKLVHLFFFTFRYFQVIHGEYHRLRDAMRVRCFRPGTNMHTYRSLAYLVGMLLVRSFDRAERVHQAMLCRGYQGKFWLLDHFHSERRDAVFLAIMLGFTLILALGPWFWKTL